jgi:hypothetical protein
MSSADPNDMHTSTGPDGPLLLCFDGSEDAKLAIQSAGALLASKPALVVTVWQPTAALGSFVWSGVTASMVDFVELDRAGAEDGGRVANAGVRIAHQAGLEAEPVAIKAAGPIWKTIVELADHHDAAAIAGSRGCARCCWGASPALSFIMPTDPHSSFTDRATTTLTDKGTGSSLKITDVTRLLCVRAGPQRRYESGEFVGAPEGSGARRSRVVSTGIPCSSWGMTSEASPGWLLR